MKNKILSLIIVFMLCTSVFISNSIAMNLVKEDIYNEETGEFVVLKDLVSENKEDSITISYADELFETSQYIHFAEKNYKNEIIKKTENAKLYSLYLKLINEINKKARNEEITSTLYTSPTPIDYYQSPEKFNSINFDKSINLKSKHYGLEGFYIEISTKKCWDLFTLARHGEDVFGFYAFYTLTDEEMNLLKALLPYEKEEKQPVVNQNVTQNKEDKKPVVNNTENKVDDKKDTSKVEDSDIKADEEETQLKEDSEKVEENEDNKDNDIEENTNEEQTMKERKNYIPIIFPIVIIVMLIATGLFLYFYNKK